MTSPAIRKLAAAQASVVNLAGYPPEQFITLSSPDFPEKHRPTVSRLIRETAACFLSYWRTPCPSITPEDCLQKLRQPIQRIEQISRLNLQESFQFDPTNPGSVEAAKQNWKRVRRYLERQNTKLTQCLRDLDVIEKTFVSNTSASGDKVGQRVTSAIAAGSEIQGVKLDGVKVPKFSRLCKELYALALKYPIRVYRTKVGALRGPTYLETLRKLPSIHWEILVEGIVVDVPTLDSSQVPIGDCQFFVDWGYLGVLSSPVYRASQFATQHNSYDAEQALYPTCEEPLAKLLDERLWHPQVSSGADLCLGDAKYAFASMSLRGNLFTAVDTAIGVLWNYGGAADSYTSFVGERDEYEEESNEVVCYRCEDDFDRSQYGGTCSACGEDYCDNCCQFCRMCSRCYCESCISSDNVCSCDNCGSLLCISCQPVLLQRRQQRAEEARIRYPHRPMRVAVGYIAVCQDCGNHMCDHCQERVATYADDIEAYVCESCEELRAEAAAEAAAFAAAAEAEAAAANAATEAAVAPDWVRGISNILQASAPEPNEYLDLPTPPPRPPEFVDLTQMEAVDPSRGVTVVGEARALPAEIQSPPSAGSYILPNQLPPAPAIPDPTAFDSQAFWSGVFSS